MTTERCGSSQGNCTQGMSRVRFFVCDRLGRTAVATHVSFVSPKPLAPVSGRLAAYGISKINCEWRTRLVVKGQLDECSSQYQTVSSRPQSRLSAKRPHLSRSDRVSDFLKVDLAFCRPGGPVSQFEDIGSAPESCHSSFPLAPTAEREPIGGVLPKHSSATTIDGMRALDSRGSADSTWRWRAECTLKSCT